LSTPAGLRLTRLALTQFRNYESLVWRPAARITVLHGPNGSGKTNLLEAVSLLVPGRGLRGARHGELARRGSGATGSWGVAGRFLALEGDTLIGTGTPPDGPADRRVFRINRQAPRSQAELAAHVAAVWLTPQMDRLFVEGASPRRRFLDRLVYGFDPEHASRVGAYEQAMRERAKLLREGPYDAAWLDALEESMARHGVAIAAARRDVAARLDAACAAGVAGFPSASLAVTGTVEAALADRPALAVEDESRTRLAASRRQDAESGGVSTGPHRSDLAVRHAATGVPAGQCSTGEQKALLIAILLANSRLQAALRGVAPIMLLDEIIAHLDRERRQALFAELLALGAQAWLTGTDEDSFAELRGAAQFLRVANASIAAAAR
jgi:DNA replication and repair protein RecF